MICPYCDAITSPKLHTPERCQQRIVDQIGAFERKAAEWEERLGRLRYDHVELTDDVPPEPNPDAVAFHY